MEVINAALPGMSLPRATQFCGADLSKLEPDIVIYYPTPTTYLNDVPPPSVLRRMGDDVTPEEDGVPVFRMGRRLEALLKQTLPTNGPGLAALVGAQENDARPTGFMVLPRTPSDRLRPVRNNLEELIECVQMSGAPAASDPCDACNRFASVTATA